MNGVLLSRNKARLVAPRVQSSRGVIMRKYWHQLPYEAIDSLWHLHLHGLSCLFRCDVIAVHSYLATSQKRCMSNSSQVLKILSSQNKVYRGCQCTFWACIKPQEHGMKESQLSFEAWILERGAIDINLVIKKVEEISCWFKFYVDDIILDLLVFYGEDFEDHYAKGIQDGFHGWNSLLFGLSCQSNIMWSMIAFSDSDYAGDNHDRRSTSGGCQYLGRRLVSWQCKKQTIVAISSTEAEYVAAASCCAQTESTICIVKNLFFTQRTSLFRIRILLRDCYEQRLINVVKVHTDDNVADLLTKGFDLARFKFLVVTIGMMNP
ncbi:hypothetical protein Tco_0894489 [Tanacetum coccineum]|uniref:Uncharacterized protein n=1 Tax=Tanacetum coccineum TaxID=301880 RepID=A0ABQ5CEC9_9ASTR